MYIKSHLKNIVRNYKMTFRLNKRLTNINKLNELKHVEIKENERLKRIKIMLQESIIENYVISGSLNEIEEQLKVMKREKKINKGKLIS